MYRLLIPVLVVLLGLPGCVTPTGSRSDAADRVVPIEAEPNHKIRFDNGRVRVYEVVLAPGRATLMHEHRADSFAVILGSAEIFNQPRGGEPRNVKVSNGFVGFTPGTNKPYSHRIGASGDAAFHVVVLELMGPAAAGAPGATRRIDPPFKMVRESPRGRAFRIPLAPGAVTPAYARPAGSALLAVSAGRLTEILDGGRTRLWDMEPGSLRWFDSGETLSLKNEGAAPVDLVEIEVF